MAFLWKTSILHRLIKPNTFSRSQVNNDSMSEIAAQQVIATPIGEVAIAASNKGVVRVEILTEHRRPTFADDPVAKRHCEQAAVQLTEFFEGNRKDFDLAFDLHGTDFQKSVWEEIVKIKFGETKSYGDLAHQVGKPLAARAIGGAVGSNPVPLLIGCHRVLGSSGKITGYSGGEGIKTKRWLLAHEGIGYKSD